MPISREKVIAELDARNLEYNEDMSYAELAEILKKAEDEEVPVADKTEPKEEPIDYTGIRCGVSTIHDLHRRVTLLERKLEKN